MKKEKQINILVELNFKKQIENYCIKNDTTISQETRKMWKEKLGYYEYNFSGSKQLSKINYHLNNCKNKDCDDYSHNLK